MCILYTFVCECKKNCGFGKIFLCKPLIFIDCSLIFVANENYGIRKQEQKINVDPVFYLNRCVLIRNIRALAMVDADHTIRYHFLCKGDGYHLN